MRYCTVLAAFGLALANSASWADPAPFDLQGPALRVSISRNGETLPIALVPQLAAGDSITVRADFPDDQSAHYVLIAAVLRGSTNPPPDKWFYAAETWTKKGRKGLQFNVPDGSTQVALFLAPATGGDVSTLRNAVQGRPGAFVRAAQELAQASLDRGRLDTFLSAVHKIDPNDPHRLDRITPLLARSLQVKINSDCLTKLPELQASCLLQNQESLVLNDGHSNAITDAMDGPGSDLALQLSATPQGGLGYYSPYIAAIRDVIGIFSSIHTAKYQYIPALATLDGDRMQLVLNAPPSFHNPKSVLVTSLPIVSPVHIPPLQTVNPKPVLCAQSSNPLLEVVGAPLIYATHYAHDLKLRVRRPDGSFVDLPAIPDAERGGLVIRDGSLLPKGSEGSFDATLHGIWGFQPFEGPHVQLQSFSTGQWRLPARTEGEREKILSISGGAASCVTGVTAESGKDAPHPISWKVVASDQIAVTLPGQDRGDEPIAIEVAGPMGTSAERLIVRDPAQTVAPTASIIARNIEVSHPPDTLAYAMGSQLEIPSDGRLTFSLRTQNGTRLTSRELIELSSDAGGGTAKLDTSNGVTQVDEHVALVVISPGKVLGPSAFGTLRARLVQNGVAGDWLTVGTLVRMPILHSLYCPPDSVDLCTLSGDRLFLLSAISATANFEHASIVPDGYAETSIKVPRPINGTLFVRLHDDPDETNQITGL